MTPCVRLTQLLLAGAALSLLGTTAYAQDPAPAATAPAGEVVETSTSTQTADDAEEITVTATRRATKIQSTPIAITAVGQKAIENAGIRETQSLTQVVPSLSFPQSESSGSVTARIRGVGTQGSNPGLESAVGIFIDGVYRSRNSVAFGDLGDIQRVEVLRGPQGTLFGRNTSAGLISVITREPDFDKFSANASGTYESFDGYYFNANVTGPVSDDAAFRLFGSYRKRDGFMAIKSGPLQTERDGNKKEGWNLRGQFQWNVSESTTVRLIGDYGHKDDECCYAAVWRPGGVGVSGTEYNTLLAIKGYPVTGNSNTVNDQVGWANREHPQIVDEYGFSAEVNSDLGWGNLTSITAYRYWKLAGGSDADYTAADILWTDPDVGFQNFKTFTQEFRLTGSTDWADWLVGVFYSNETLDRETSTLNGTDTEAWLSRFNLSPVDNTRTRVVLGSILGPTRRPTAPAYAGGNTHALGTGLHDYYNQTAESIALFTHNTFTLTEQLKLTLGLRYTSETKDVEATYRTVSPAGCAYLESVYGLNPLGRYNTASPGVGSGDAAGAPAASLYCVPWGRSALDVLTATAPLTQTKDENEFSGIVTLAYAFNDDLNVYGTYSRGYKAGGFNLDRYFSVDNDTATGSSIVRCPDGSDGTVARPYTCAAPTTVIAPDLSFAPEFVDAFEIGAKTTLADGSLLLNLALYHQTFENYQLNTFTGISFVVTSVPKVIADGVELDMTWFTPVEGLSFTGGLAWSDTRYGENLGDLSTPGSFIFENPNLYNLPGQNLTSAPVWTVTAGGTYETPLFGGAWTGLAHFDLRYQSAQRTGSNLDPAKTQDGYYLVNFRFGLESEDERIAIELWMKNAFDERYAQITFDQPTQGSAPTATVPNPANFSQIGAFLAEPRTMGITLKTKF
jgi:iron complex outermembrane receptor protein